LPQIIGERQAGRAYLYAARTTFTKGNDPKSFKGCSIKAQQFGIAVFEVNLAIPMIFIEGKKMTIYVASLKLLMALRAE